MSQKNAAGYAVFALVFWVAAMLVASACATKTRLREQYDQGYADGLTKLEETAETGQTAAQRNIARLINQIGEVKKEMEDVKADAENCQAVGNLIQAQYDGLQASYNALAEEYYKLRTKYDQSFGRWERKIRAAEAALEGK